MFTNEAQLKHNYGRKENMRRVYLFLSCWDFFFFVLGTVECSISSTHFHGLMLVFVMLTKDKSKECVQFLRLDDGSR